MKGAAGGFGSSRGTKRASTAAASEWSGGVGFEAFRVGSDDFASPIYSGSEDALRLPFRALLTKKDSITRVKALTDLEEAFRTLPVEAVREGLAHWAFLYERCQKDNEKRVRFHSAHLMKLLVERLPKAMGDRRLDTFAADWLCACFDPEQDTATVSKQAFDDAKVSKFSDSVLRKLCTYVRQRGPDESFEEFGGTDEEINERAVRVRSQALRALAFVIGHELGKQLDLAELNESSTWSRFLVANENEGGVYVRKAAYQLLAALAEGEHREVVSQNNVLKSITRIIAEKERSATASMWNALVLTCKNCPEFWNNLDSLRKGFFPELFRHLDRRLNDAGFVAGSHLVVFLSVLPQSVWDSYGIEGFCREWFDKLVSDEKCQDVSIMLASIECLNYVSKTRLVEGEDSLLAFLSEKVGIVFDCCIAKGSTLQPYQNDIMSNLVSCISTCSWTTDDISERFAINDMRKVLTFLSALLKSKNSRMDNMKNLFSSVCLGVIPKALQDSRTDDLLVDLLDSRPEFFENSLAAIQEWEKLFHSNSVTAKTHTKFAAKLIALANDATFFDEMIESLKDEEDGLMTFLGAVRSMNWKPSTPSPILSAWLRSTSVGLSLFEGRNEVLISELITPEVRQERIQQIFNSAADLIESRDMSQQDYIGVLLPSIRAYAEELWPQNRAWVFSVLQCFDLNVEPKFFEPNPDLDETYLLNWLCDCSAPFSRIDFDYRWAFLVNSLRKQLPRLPSADLALALVEQYGLKTAENLLGFSDTATMIWWIFLNKSRDPVSNKNFVLDDTWLNQLVSFLLNSETSQGPSEGVILALREIFNLDFPILHLHDWIATAAGTDSEFSQGVFLEILLEKMASMGMDHEFHDRICGELSDPIVRSVQMIKSSLNLKSARPSPSPSPSPSDSAFAAMTILKVGDAVIYTKDGQRSAATVVGRHDDGSDSYYTIRWWSEDRARETQTTRDKLTLRSEVNKEQLKEEDNKKKLGEIQKLLQEARQSGNRQESIRLMKLQAELLPKPKDTEEEKAKVEAARAKAADEWRQGRKSKQSALVSGDAEADDGLSDEDEGKQDWDDSVRSGMRILSRFLWRRNIFKFTQSENDAIHEVVLDYLPRLRLPKDEADMSLLAKVLILAPTPLPDKDSEAAFFVSRLISSAGHFRQPVIVEVCLEYNQIVSEAAAGQVLQEFCLSNESEQFAIKATSVVSKMRLASRLVWDLSPSLFANLCTRDDLGQVIACFVCLFRYPKLLTGLPSAAVKQEDGTETIEESGEEDLLAIAQSYFPPFLLSSLQERFLNMNEDAKDQTEKDHIKSVLTWLLVLRYVQLTWKVNSARAREAIGQWLRDKNLIFHILGLVSGMLDFSQELNPVSKSSAEDDVGDDVTFLLSTIDTSEMPVHLILSKLASRAFFQTVHVFPALVREWWTDHLPNRFDKEGVSRFTAAFVTPNVLRADMSELNEAVRNRAWDPSELSVKFSLATRVVTILSFKDDCSLEMEISFPDTYPLLPAEVECTKQIGVRQDKWKRWALQIVMLLGKRDGTLLDAVQLWKQNLDKEFEGVEPCPICYSVLHAVDSSMPRVRCKTCKNVFHGKCLSQWFTSSHQSLCPLCKQSFMANS